MRYTPIFIGGCDRSGTTLLGDLLGASRYALATPESQFLPDLAHQVASGVFQSRMQAAHWLRQHFRFAVWELACGEQDLAGMLDLENLRESMERIIQAYVMQCSPEKADVSVWVDHTPDNLKHYALLKSLFADARFVHIVRDGRGVCSSIAKLDWGPNNPYTVSRYWTERLRQAATVELAEGDRCVVVRYEDLLERPEIELARVCSELGIPFCASQLNGGGVVLPAFTRKQHRLVGHRPDASRAFAWRNKMTPSAIAVFEGYEWSRVLLKKYGYPLLSPGNASNSTLRTLGYYVHDFGCYLRNRWRHKKVEVSTVNRQFAVNGIE
ncbi:MAG: sulfotransferase [Gammaproteobacteria bacterium]|nr:sulfotransferase [Gammaproteobacteria bacterium]MDH3468218.1 sulfotransferase [Gammaproteobacteria bacterium]